MIVLDLKALGNLFKFIVKHLDKAKQVVALPRKGDAHGANSGGIKVFTMFQFGDDEIEKFTAGLKTKCRQHQDVQFQSGEQGFLVHAPKPFMLSPISRKGCFLAL